MHVVAYLVFPYERGGGIAGTGMPGLFGAMPVMTGQAGATPGSARNIHCLLDLNYLRWDGASLNVVLFLLVLLGCRLVGLQLRGFSVFIYSWIYISRSTFQELGIYSLGIRA